MNPYYSTDHDLLFYPILKNGSSGYRVALEKHGFVKFLGYDDFSDTVAFALLREPVRRYFSAVAQMYRSYILPIHGTDWDEYIMAVAAIIRATGKPWRFENDPHFLRQADTVAEMPENQRLFLLGDTKSLGTWLDLQGIHLQPPAGNRTPDDVIHDLEMVIDPAPILDWYRADTQLVASI